jgi:hypothetical protein
VTGHLFDKDRSLRGCPCVPRLKVLSQAAVRPKNQSSQGKIKDPCQAGALRVPLILPCEPAVGADHCVAIKSLRLCKDWRQNHRITGDRNLVGLCRKQVEGEWFAAVRAVQAARSRYDYWFGRSQMVIEDVRSSTT